MSNLQVDLLESKSGIGLTCTPDDLFYQRAFAWCSFHGNLATSGTPDLTGVDEFFNISAIVEDSLGLYTFFFDTNAINTKYIILGSAGPGNTGTITPGGSVLTVQPERRNDGSSGLTTTSFSIRNNTLSGGANSVSSRDYISVIVFGGF